MSPFVETILTISLIWKKLDFEFFYNIGLVISISVRIFYPFDFWGYFEDLTKETKGY